MTYQCEEKRFLDDVASHKMEVVRNDGVNRHLRFKRPNTTNYHFDILTWPGHLVVTGDCGTYVFSRVQDMFGFFRMDGRDFNHRKDVALNINPGYWAEKVLSESRFGNGVEEYSEEKFKARVKDYFDSHFQHEIEEENAVRSDASLEEPITPEEESEFVEAAKKRAELWQEIEWDVLRHADNEHLAYQAAYNFESDEFQFVDFFDCNLKQFTFHYIWCIYAVVWGIQQFDMAMLEQMEAA